MTQEAKTTGAKNGNAQMVNILHNDGSKHEYVKYDRTDGKGSDIVSKHTSYDGQKSSTTAHPDGTVHHK